MSRLWDKGAPLDEQVLAFTVGNDFELDARLVPYDVRASIAHAQMLAAQGYLTGSEVVDLERELRTLAETHARAEWAIGREDEDVHTALENRLSAALGPLGGKIHLGRSRNDQVLVALRLYYLDVVAEANALLAEFVTAMDSWAVDQDAVFLPGYTHFQRAMPSSVGDWARAYASECRNSLALLDAAAILADSCPLGSAAGYGTPGLTLDRAMTARSLGFSNVQVPVTAAQMSRGKAESALAFALVTILNDVAKWASDLILFSTQEFGFVRLPDRFTTGSSIMPQKRNPDVFELLRGRASSAQGDLVSILALVSKLPSGYHRDFQLLKDPLFRLIDSFAESMQMATSAARETRFDPVSTAAEDSSDLHAAEAAFALVSSEGIPFREAYRRVAANLGK